MDLVENIQYNIDKAMMEDGEFYAAVVTYLNGTRDDRSAQTVLWELSHSREVGIFFVGLDFSEFKYALDKMQVPGGGREK